MPTSYIRPAVRALAIERESYNNWLYFAGRSKGAFHQAPLDRQDGSRWRSTALARFFARPDVLYFD